MKRLIILLLPFAALLSCEKHLTSETEKSDPPPPADTYLLHHSGNHNGHQWILNDTARKAICQVRVSDYNQIYKIYTLTVWTQGPDIPEDINLTTDSTYSFQIVAVSKYDISDILPLGQLPSLTSQRLIDAINSTEYEWNDAQERKQVYFNIGYEALVGGPYFKLVNPQIQASASGSSVRITGSFDSIAVAPLNSNWEPAYVKDFEFDYIVPPMPY